MFPHFLNAFKNEREYTSCEKFLDAVGNEAHGVELPDIVEDAKQAMVQSWMDETKDIALTA